MTGATGRGRAARLLIAIVLAISAGTWLAAPAFAAVSITVNKTEGLNPKGETVKVEGAGFKPGIQLYLVTCNPAIPSGGACDLANFPGPVDVKPDGTWSASLKVVAKFGTVDCFKTACAIQTSRVGQGADRTQEAYAAISFTGQTVPAWVPSATPAASETATAPASPSATPSDTAAAPATPDATDVASTTTSDSGTSPAVWIVVAVVVVALVGGGIAYSRRNAANSKT